MFRFETQVHIGRNSESGCVEEGMTLSLVEKEDSFG